MPKSTKKHKQEVKDMALKTLPLKSVSDVKSTLNKQTFFSRMKKSLSRKSIGLAIGSTVALAGAMHLSDRALKHQNNKRFLQDMHNKFKFSIGSAVTTDSNRHYYQMLNDYWFIYYKMGFDSIADEKVIDIILTIAAYLRRDDDILRVKILNNYTKNYHIVLKNNMIALISKNDDNDVLFENQDTLENFILIIKSQIK
jgi:hypothetical protein